MNIIIKNIKNLIPYKNNPRKNDKAINEVAASIKNYGFKVPVIIDKQNVIVTGHTRVKAAERLGIEDIPCVIADDLSEEQIKAFRIADNKTHEFAEWDISKLAVELKDITEYTGFSDKELQDMAKEAEIIIDKDLVPYKKVHYLISLDLNINDEILEHIEQIKKIRGVEVESTLN
jgi:ParB/RepB/Spo0J family partition protein